MWRHFDVVNCEIAFVAMGSVPPGWPYVSLRQRWAVKKHRSTNMFLEVIFDRFVPLLFAPKGPGKIASGNAPHPYSHFSCLQSPRPTGANVLRLAAKQRKKAPLPVRPAGSEVSFTSIPAGQAGPGIALLTPFWLIEKRIHLRGTHAGVFKSGNDKGNAPGP